MQSTNWFSVSLGFKLSECVGCTILFVPVVVGIIIVLKNLHVKYFFYLYLL
jgi:hypothetical protein